MLQRGATLIGRRKTWYAAQRFVIYMLTICYCQASNAEQPKQAKRHVDEDEEASKTGSNKRRMGNRPANNAHIVPDPTRDNSSPDLISPPNTKKSSTIVVTVSNTASRDSYRHSPSYQSVSGTREGSPFKSAVHDIRRSA